MNGRYNPRGVVLGIWKRARDAVVGIFGRVNNGDVSDPQGDEPSVQVQINKKSRMPTIVMVCLAVVFVIVIVFSRRGTAPESVRTSSIGIMKKAQVGDMIRFAGHAWRVLETTDGRLLILCNRVLENREFHSPYEETTWAESEIRAYLNGSFFDITFNAEEKTLIADTMLANDDNPWFGTSGGADTTDKVFLLSLDELARYFDDSGQLLSRPGDDEFRISDLHNPERAARDADGYATWWWLRSSGFDGTLAAAVGTDGHIYLHGYFVDDPYGGLRPALWLDLRSSAPEYTPQPSQNRIQLSDSSWIETEVDANNNVILIKHFNIDSSLTYEMVIESGIFSYDIIENEIDVFMFVNTMVSRVRESEMERYGYSSERFGLSWFSDGIWFVTKLSGDGSATYLDDGGALLLIDEKMYCYDPIWGDDVSLYLAETSAREFGDWAYYSWVQYSYDSYGSFLLFETTELDEIGSPVRMLQIIMTVGSDGNNYVVIRHGSPYDLQDNRGEVFVVPATWAFAPRN